MNYVAYDENLHGKLTYPEGFAELLTGLSLEQQMEYFRIGNGVYLRQNFLKRRKSDGNYSQSIQNSEYVESVIVCNNMIAGVMVKNCHNRIVPCLPEGWFIIRDDSEADGSGYKDFQLFLYLICVTKDFYDN